MDLLNSSHLETRLGLRLMFMRLIGFYQEPITEVHLKGPLFIFCCKGNSLGRIHTPQ
jgi:hypothetical protein